MVKLHCLGGFREVGRNAVLVESKSANIMLDYGFAVESGEIPKIPKEKVDACFITHGHLDHLGMAPMLHHRKNNMTYANAPKGYRYRPDNCASMLDMPDKQRDPREFAGLKNQGAT